MDETRNTVDMLTRGTLGEAYEAYCHGMDVGRLAARLEVYPVELQRRFDEMDAERQRRATDQRASAMGRLQDVLFDELDRLNELDVGDTDTLKAEAERSRAIEGIAKTAIENVNVAIDATRLKAQLAQGAAIAVPRMLEG